MRCLSHFNVDLMCPHNRPSGNQSHVEGFAFYAIFSVLIDIDFLPPLAAKTESSSRDPQKKEMKIYADCQH